MNKLLLLLLALIPVAAQGQKNAEVTGHWKEVERIPGGKTKPIAFTDTIRLQFNPGNEVLWQMRGSLQYKSVYKLSKDVLDLGHRRFSVLQRKANSMRLQDEDNTYELVRYTPPAIPELADESAPVAVTSIAQMKGHWSKFKGTSDRTVREVDYTRAIKFVDITGDIMGDGRIGMVFGGRDPDTEPSWYIESYDPKTQILTCGGKDKRRLKVLRCQDNELRIEENGTTYFLRKFKQ
ncbi:MAG: hypothetical protein JNL72_14500 [Flavipsychrobacter sp.]|nr:hypothetical protein [Flavipsychrobacter sp.]